MSELEILKVQEEFSRGPGGMRMHLHYAADMNWRILNDYGSDEENLAFDVANFNKRFVTLNLKIETGLEVAYKLLAVADVFVTSVRTRSLWRRRTCLTACRWTTALWAAATTTRCSSSGRTRTRKTAGMGLSAHLYRGLYQIFAGEEAATHHFSSGGRGRLRLLRPIALSGVRLPLQAGLHPVCVSVRRGAGGASHRPDGPLLADKARVQLDRRN